MNNQKKKLAKLDPAAVFYDTRTEKLATTVSWFDYQGHNSAGKTYGLYAFFVLDGKLAVLSFDCPFKNRGEWETVAQSALPTLRVIPIGERELLAA